MHDMKCDVFFLAGHGEHRLWMLKTLTILLSSVELQHHGESRSSSWWLWPGGGVGGADALCAGTNCEACERRFGCLTESWGKCCVQFFQLNGKKRALTQRAAAAATPKASKSDGDNRRSAYLDEGSLQRRRLTSRMRDTLYIKGQ